MSSNEDTFFAVLLLTAIVGLIFLFFSTLFFALPVIGAGFGGYMFYYWRHNSATALERKAREHTHSLYEEAKQLPLDVPGKIEFGKAVYTDVPDLPDELDEALVIACLDLYDDEHFEADLPPPPPPICNSIEGARYRDFLSEYTSKVNHPRIAQLAIDTIRQSFKSFTDGLPEFSTGEEFATVPLAQLIDLRQLIENLILPFYQHEGIFENLRRQLDINLHEVSGVPLQLKDSPKLILPSEYKGENSAYAYLKDTPLLQIADARIPLCIPLSIRYEHHHILAGTGHGKTQAIQSLILDDIKRVADGKATIVVIDSQDELIPNISNLRLFAKGEPLEGKLCLVDPTDTEYPISLNIFDLGMERIKSYSSSDQQKAINTIIDLMEFVLSSLLEAAMTQKQSLLFRFCVRLMLNIPNATIHTFRELLEPEGFEKYERYIKSLPQTARGFFETQFNDNKQFGDTKSQVLRRIYGILENQSLERMMAQTKSKLDLFAEISKPNVILINTSVNFLSQKNTEFFGRFFIAMILNATQQRATMNKPKHPVFVYIDEFGDYAAHADDKITTIFGQARKQNVGMIVAHQRLSDLSPKTLSALDANTSIKFAGGVAYQDLRAVAGMLRTDQSFVEEQKKGSFAAYIKSVTPRAVSLSFPFRRLEKEPQMTREERQAVISEIRRKYATHYTEVQQTESLPDDPDHVDTGAS